MVWREKIWFYIHYKDGKEVLECGSEVLLQQ